MSAEDNRALIDRLLAFPNTGEMADVDEIIDENFEYRASNGEQYFGRDGFRELISTYRTAFPDLALRREQVIAEGDSVAVLLTMTGTHEGDLMDIPPTGNEISLPMFTRIEFRDGRIVDMFEFFDSADMLRQLGVLERQSPTQPGSTRPRV